jgi:hypothetical protein
MPEDTKKPRPLCTVCGKPIEHGMPRYRLNGGLASVHVECRGKAKPKSPGV